MLTTKELIQQIEYRGLVYDLVDNNSNVVIYGVATLGVDLRHLYFTKQKWNSDNPYDRSLLGLLLEYFDTPVEFRGTLK